VATSVAPAPAPAPPPASDLRAKLHGVLMNMGLAFTADAVEHSRVEEQNGVVAFVTPEDFRLAMKETDLQQAVQAVLGGGRRIRVAFGESGVTALARPEGEAGDDEAFRRALAHPEVRHFQEMFPDSQVRVVRNLKE
jgi:hypothetical protein